MPVTAATPKKVRGVIILPLTTKMVGYMVYTRLNWSDMAGSTASPVLSIISDHRKARSVLMTPNGRVVERWSG
jgi:hypothetical protein